MEKVLRIRGFLCFLYDFTNNLPIFLESRTCNYNIWNEKCCWEIAKRRQMLMENRLIYDGKNNIMSDFIRTEDILLPFYKSVFIWISPQNFCQIAKKSYLFGTVYTILTKQFLCKVTAYYIWAYKCKKKHILKIMCDIIESL